MHHQGEKKKNSAKYYACRRGEKIRKNNKKVVISIVKCFLITPGKEKKMYRKKVMGWRNSIYSSSKGRSLFSIPRSQVLIEYRWGIEIRAKT